MAILCCAKLVFMQFTISLEQLCPTLVQPHYVQPYILTTFPYFNNLDFDIFDAGGPQCHFITSVTIVVRIRTLSGH